MTSALHIGVTNGMENRRNVCVAHRFFYLRCVREKKCIPTDQQSMLVAPCHDAPSAEVHFNEGNQCGSDTKCESLERRASTRVAHLLKGQGRRQEALDLLQPIYDWFTEGRSTKDHIEARALLDELRGG
jgi:hypothetical protein